MNSTQNSPKPAPRTIQVILYFVICLLALSALCLLYSVINFQTYADAFIATHPGSFHDVNDTTVAHRIVLGALIMRLLASLTWVGSFLYLKRFLINNEKHRLSLMLGYGLMSLVGFVYLIFHAEIQTIAIIRAVQVAITLAMLIFLLISVVKEKRKKADRTESPQK